MSVSHNPEHGSGSVRPHPRSMQQGATPPIHATRCRATRNNAIFQKVEASLLPKNHIYWYYHWRPSMAKNTSISLGDHFTRFVDQQLAQGRYGSASEVVRAGLRLLEEHEAKVKALQQALIEGEESGPPAPFDNEAFLKRMREKHVR